MVNIKFNSFGDKMKIFNFYTGMVFEAFAIVCFLVNNKSNIQYLGMILFLIGFYIVGIRYQDLEKKVIKKDLGIK